MRSSQGFHLAARARPSAILAEVTRLDTQVPMAWLSSGWVLACAMTLGSGVTPAKALSKVSGDTPEAAASGRSPARKAEKSAAATAPDPAARWRSAARTAARTRFDRQIVIDRFRQPRV